MGPHCCNVHSGYGMFSSIYFDRIVFEFVSGAAYVFGLKMTADLQCFVACSLSWQAAMNARDRLKAIVLAQKRIKELVLAKQAAEKANQLKTNFVASVSHGTKNIVFAHVYMSR